MAAVDLYPSRTRARLETRARVFDAALAEFHRVGVEATRIEDVVRTAGVARGTFYLHFASKDEVLVELLARCDQRIAMHLEGLDPRWPGRALRVVADAIAAEAAGKHAALLPAALAAIGRNPDEVARRAPALSEGLTTFLAAGRRAGTVRDQAAPADLAAVLLASLVGLLVTHRQSSPSGLRATLRRTVELLEPVLLIPGRC